MGRREHFSCHELEITPGGGIRSGKKGFLSKVLKMYVAVPAAIVADRYFASAAMHNGAYAVANDGLPGDSMAHNVTMCVTDVGGTDTRGTITVVGKDFDGDKITEVFTPGATGVTVPGLKAFKQVTSITGAGWVTADGADTIVIGFGELVGLPDCLLTDENDVLLVAHNTALVNAPTVTHDATVLALNKVTVPTGDGAKVLRVIYQI